MSHCSKEQRYEINSNAMCHLAPSLLIKMLVDGRNVHILRYGEVILAYTWFGLNFMLTRTACGLSNMNCTSALTMTEKNAFKNQNGVTVVQAFKTELGGHCGCGFTYIPASLTTWIFWTVSNSKTPPDVFKTISASSCQLQPYGLKVSPYNYVMILDPNQSLLNKHPYFLPAPILILDKQCVTVVFCLY